MNPETFEQWWSRLVATLHPGFTIFHWSAYRGYTLKGNFKISNINLAFGEIWITEPGQCIPKDHFERLYPHWRAYTQEKIIRKELEKILSATTSTYVISIMKWMETEATKIERALRKKRT